MEFGIIFKRNTKQADPMAFKEIKIRVPKTINIMQMSSWIKLNTKINMKDLDGIQMLEFKAKTLVIFTNLNFYEAMRVDVRDLNKTFNSLLSRLKNITSDLPKETLMVGEHKFKFCTDMSRLSAGQVIDIKKLGNNVLDKPEYFLSILYESDTISRNESQELFKKEFPVKEFISVFNFFFLKSARWKNALQVVQEIRTEELKRMEKMMRLENRLANGTRLQRASSSLVITLIEMWMTLRLCLMQLFYFGTTLRISRIWKRRGRSKSKGVQADSNIG